MIVRVRVYDKRTETSKSDIEIEAHVILPFVLTSLLSKRSYDHVAGPSRRCPQFRVVTYQHRNLCIAERGRRIPGSRELFVEFSQQTRCPLVSYTPKSPQHRMSTCFQKRPRHPTD